MNDKKFIPFWMEKPKIEIIEAYVECIHNGEVLLKRIEKAVEYIKEHSSNGEQFMEWFECTDLLNILNGRSDE